MYGAGRTFHNFPAVPIMRVVGDKGGMQIGYLLQVVSALMQASSTTVTSVAIAMWVGGAGLSFLSIGRQSCTLRALWPRHCITATPQHNHHDCAHDLCHPPPPLPLHTHTVQTCAWR